MKDNVDSRIHLNCAIKLAMLPVANTARTTVILLKEKYRLNILMQSI